MRIFINSPGPIHFKKGINMSIFNTILQKLGIQKPAAPAATTKPATPATPAAPATPGKITPMAGPGARPKSFTPPPVAPKPTEMPMVDVVSKLEGLAKANPQELDWKVSIVDLLKLLGMDSSYEARKELAVELACPASEMDDSAKMNIWLHKTILKKIAENGGNIPQNLLH
jgi:hypothetical protein